MKFETRVKKFVSKLENKGVIDRKNMIKILEKSTAWNKHDLMKDLIEKVEVFRSYDEEKGTQFPWKPYAEKFLSE